MRSPLLKLASVLIVIGFVCVCFKRIGPDEIGVRADNFGFGARGIVQQDFEPGLHLGIPILHTWTALPARVLRVELTQNPMFKSALGGDQLLVQSSDGDRVMLDLHIMYRITPGEGHRALVDTGAAEDGRVTVLKSLVGDRLRAILGTMKTEEFYDAKVRQEKVGVALTQLRARCKDRFIDVVDVLIEDVLFDPKYEQKIRDKKLADQNALLNGSLKLLAEKKTEVEQVKVGTDSLVAVTQQSADNAAAVTLAEARKYSTEKHSSADLYSSQKTAAGNLLQKQAEADVRRASTEAMSSSGAGNVIALEAIKNLTLSSMQFSTVGTDWTMFDPVEMAKRLGAGK